MPGSAVTFELAAIIIVAVAAIALGLICYHLLGRLERLEQAVQGGLEPPGSRLSREQFERRFKVAHARATLAKRSGTGLVVIVGDEFGPDHELARTIDHLSRPDLIQVIPVDQLDGIELGISTTPYLFVIEEARVRAAQPVVAANDVIAILEQFA